MKGQERREQLIRILRDSKAAVTGKELAGMLGVSRQIVVQDITLLRAQNYDILSTTEGYILHKADLVSRVFKVAHLDQQVGEELNLIVDLGGTVEDVFVYHKVYGTISGKLNISSRRDVQDFLDSLAQGKSSLLKNVTSGYHYHTVSASSELLLDLIQAQLKEHGFLAKLQDYEPVDFGKGNE